MSILAASLVLALCPTAQELELLPDVPTGWRFERIDFPLDFAPELGDEGLEELAFAPGMFDPDSDSYWSYALDVRIEEDVEVDEAWLTSFLDGYYRGLCRAVGASRDPVPDLSDFAVEVAFDGERFSATIETVDAFVTGGPLTLFLKLDVQRGARATELFGLASPLDDEAPIWKKLEALRARWLAERPVPVFLNQVSLVLDEKTYAELASSGIFGGGFAPSETRDDHPLEGLEFYGRSTSFMILRIQGPFSADWSRVVLGVERPGGSARVAELIHAGGPIPTPTPVELGLGGVQLPWADVLFVAGAAPGFGVLTMEYDPRFLAGWRPELPPERPGIRRADVLARYAAWLRRAEADPAPPFVDVRVVYVDLEQAEADELSNTLRRLGWVVDEQDGTLRCDGPGVELQLRTADGPARVTGFDLELRAPVEREPLRLGRASLSFEGRTARFRYPDPAGNH